VLLHRRHQPVTVPLHGIHKAGGRVTEVRAGLQHVIRVREPDDSPEEVTDLILSRLRVGDGVQAWAVRPRVCIAFQAHVTTAKANPLGVGKYKGGPITPSACRASTASRGPR